MYLHIRSKCILIHLKHMNGWELSYTFSVFNVLWKIRKCKMGENSFFFTETIQVETLSLNMAHFHSDSFIYISCIRVNNLNNETKNFSLALFLTIFSERENAFLRKNKNVCVQRAIRQLQKPKRQCLNLLKRKFTHKIFPGVLVSL